MTEEERHELLCELVDRALDVPPDDRRSFLAEACGDNAELRRDVESLLAEATTQEGRSSRDELSREGDREMWATSPKSPPVELVQIGSYRILELLGSGGMGAVYLAEQDEPVRRRVALKLIHANLHNPVTLGRFQAERNALARLSHRNVAQLFDAGATADGFPYFAMEHVPSGEALTSYCDRLRLSLEQRLQLFVQVCQGVQHAHQKGVLHRDLKPGNVLVTEIDGTACPKVIDFGLAKAVDDLPLTDGTQALTRFGVAGTPAYMSPEARAGSLDVDIRADVYSLGILLYELIAGARPRAEKDRRSAPRERPSTRLARLGATSSSRVAERRRLSAADLAGRLRGDLDWIVMTAIAAEPERRYASVSDLAADLEHHLADEPIAARPPAAAYRLRKFVRRHRAIVVAAALMAAALLFGVIATTLAMLQARRAESEAMAQAARADREAAAATQVVELLIALFEVSDPSQARGNSITAIELVDRGVARIERDLAGQPALQTRMLRTIGDVYAQLGLDDRAVVLLQRALAIARRAPEADQGEIVDILQQLSEIQRRRNLDAPPGDRRPEATELESRSRSASS